MFKSIVVVIALTTSLFSEGGFSKEYYEIKDVKTRKKAFLNTLLPKIKSAQKSILVERDKSYEILDRCYNNPESVSDKDVLFLESTAKKYRIKNIYNKNAYAKKIEIVPTSLTLAQAAVESAWGRSRFVKQANNIFGEHSKAGLKSKYHLPGQSHVRLRVFKDLEGSIASYMKNLNRHKAYKKFRNLRAYYQNRDRVFKGSKAATTMTHYSQLGEEYNRRIAKMIRVNHFEKYD